MITDSCYCCGRTGRRGKEPSRMSEQPWYSYCDQRKARRRCQSEGLYPESDPLKELNWCCDMGCAVNVKQQCSQIKKTDVEMNVKKINCTDDINMDEDHSVYVHSKKQHSKLHEDQIDIDLERQYQSYQHSELESGKYSRGQKYDEKSNPHHENLLKYHPIGDYHHQLGRSLAVDDKSPKSSGMRDRYIKEMEILKSKLNLMKSEVVGDGKRLRHRSESELGFPDLSGGVAKRAREISPKMKSVVRKLPAHPPSNRFPIKQNVHFKRESKSLSPTAIKSYEKVDNQSSFSETYYKAKDIVQNLVINERDEEVEDTCDEETSSRNLTDTLSEGESIRSSLASVSTESSTPSKQGETVSTSTEIETPKELSLDEKTSSFHSEPTTEQECEEKTSSENKALFRSSLFPNVPPYVKFFMHDFKGPALPVDITKHLKWKLSNITPIVIRRTLINSGFKLVRKSNEWTGQWGKHMKSFAFKTLKDFQKLNHFPGTFQIGRKDRLWKNLYRLMTKFGKKEFNFIPKTYILPNDRKLLRVAWEKFSGSSKGQWIVKPPAAARGTGIKVVHRWGQIPRKKALIVQKYIAQPYLINGSKFDLRLYVLMTSIHPLRIYLYDDGLVRFASVKYSDKLECLSNQFMHLTNYSINKLSTQYQVNADASSCVGHKWSLKSLWTYLAKEGVNVKALKRNLTDLVIKTIISGESNINILSKNNLPSRYSSYELFGIDVLLDQNLKPWLLEVNISPSLHSASPLDLAVKGPLVRELLNIVGFQIPPKLTREQEEGFLEAYGIKNKTNKLCYDKRLYSTSLSKEEKAKQDSFHNKSRKDYLDTILEDLTPDDIRHLIQFEDELTQIKRFEKIFPTPHTYTYHHFFESPRYYNMMLDAWETKYQNNRAEGIRLLSSFCEQELHLNVPFLFGRIKSSPSPNDPEPQEDNETDTESEEEKEEAEPEEVKKETPKTSRSSPQPKSPSRPSVVSKPSVLTPHPVSRRQKMTSPKTPPPVADHQENPAQFKETCMKVLAGIRQNRLKLPEKLKTLPICKLETEVLSNGKNVLSPGKHMHNPCIKMSTSS